MFIFVKTDFIITSTFLQNILLFYLVYLIEDENISYSYVLS